MKALNYSVLLLIALFSSGVMANQDLTNINQQTKLAIHGYDAVAYFTESRPVIGNAIHQYMDNDAIWLFSSQENLDLFTSNPKKYKPQYGGFCAYAASQGAQADIDPAAWRIIDDKLYLNYSPEVQQRWLTDTKSYIQAADAYWQNLSSK